MSEPRSIAHTERPLPDRGLGLALADVGGALRWVGAVGRARRELQRGDGRSGPPRLLQIQLTTRCNMRCRMCGQWGDQGTHKGASQHTVDAGLALSLLEAAARARAEVTLWGGEPLLHPDLDAIVAGAARLRVPLGVITNGLLLERHAELLVSGRLRDVFVSLDGPPAVHDDLRGVAGAWERVVSGMRAVDARRSAGGGRLPRLHVLATLSEDSAPHVEAHLEQIAALGIRLASVSLTLRWWIDEPTGLAYAEVMRRRLGVEATSWRGFACGPPPVDAPALAQALGRLRRRRWPFRLLVMPDLREQGDVIAFFRDCSRSFGRRACLAPWLYALLLPTGELTFCPDWPDHTLGNLRDASFEELWNGPAALDFRRLLQEGLLPICPRCCWLYLAGDTRAPPGRRPA